MDGDALLTREQIVSEAESIRLALQKSSSPSERQRLTLRYEELNLLLRVNKKKSNETQLSQADGKPAAATDSPAETGQKVFEAARRMNEARDAGRTTPEARINAQAFDDLGRLFYELLTLGAVCAMIYFAFFAPNSVAIDDDGGFLSSSLGVERVANIDMMNRNLRGTVCSGFIALLGMGKLIHRSIRKI